MQPRCLPPQQTDRRAAFLSNQILKLSRMVLGTATFVYRALGDPKDESQPLMVRSWPQHRQGLSPNPCGQKHIPVPMHFLLPPVTWSQPYLRAFWSRCRQSMARGSALRDCRKRCTWGRRMLLGGKSPVHNQSSSQPRSSLYLREEAWCPAGLLTRAAYLPSPHPSETNMDPPTRQIQIVILKVGSTNLPQATHFLVTPEVKCLYQNENQYVTKHSGSVNFLFLFFFFLSKTFL